MHWSARTIRSLLALLVALAVTTAPVAIARGSSDARFLVKLRPGTSNRSAADLIARTGGRDLHTIPGLGVHVVSVPPAREAQALKLFARSRIVAYAEPDALYEPSDTIPNDPYFPFDAGTPLGGEWGHYRTQAPAAWDITTGSPNVVIADIDSGVAAGHPDLAAQLIPGHNVLDGSANTNDTYGHGTYVAGVMAAATNNSLGVAGYCWSCRLMPVKVYSTSSGAFVSDIASGIIWAVDHGARVANISLAGSSTSTTLSSAVSYARQHGAVVVAAAGNNSCNCAKYPASIAGVIGVAASDQNDVLYSYSNFGSWVDVAAPGQNVTTWPNGYGAVGGTSMAAPVVSGIAGLLFSAMPLATPDAVEQTLFASVDPLSGTNSVAYGRVNAYRALLAMIGAAPAPSPLQNTALPTISGLPQEGQSLSASPGSWSDSPTGFAYQWQRCDGTGANCAAIAEATSSSYGLQTADVGSTLRIAVTASNAGGATTASSVPTAAVAAAPAPAPAPPTSQTLSFSGSLNPKNPSRRFSVIVGAGVAHAELSFSKCSSLSLSLYSGASVQASKSGPSIVTLETTLQPGSYSYEVSGGRCSFSLSVRSSAP